LFFSYSDLHTYAILHALPICRIENNEFVPRYTVFSITYLNRDPKNLHRAIFHTLTKDRSEDSEMIYVEPFYSNIAGTLKSENDFPAPYDLQEWATRGHLGWLDFTDMDFPLRIGKGQELPLLYRDIKGIRRAYVWRDGKMRR
jgi:hypothetical protein